MEKETPLISQDLIDMLICPVTGAVLEMNDDKTALVNKQHDVSYPIVDGIPVMIPGFKL